MSISPNCELDSHTRSDNHAGVTVLHTDSNVAKWLRNRPSLPVKLGCRRQFCFGRFINEVFNKHRCASSYL
jgi:hypothetical protein